MAARLTNREIDLTVAQERGRKCFLRQQPMPDYKGDKHLIQAWQQGYQVEKENHIAYSRMGIYY